MEAKITKHFIFLKPFKKRAQKRIPKAAEGKSESE